MQIAVCEEGQHLAVCQFDEGSKPLPQSIRPQQRLPQAPECGPQGLPDIERTRKRIVSCAQDQPKGKDAAARYPVKVRPWLDYDLKAVFDNDEIDKEAFEIPPLSETIF